jgi:hypothetical protein
LWNIGGAEAVISSITIWCNYLEVLPRSQIISRFGFFMHSFCYAPRHIICRDE